MHAVHVKGGQIQALAAPSGKRADLDYGSQLISPGLIDMHTHMDEPGREDWEGAISSCTHGSSV